MITITVFVTAGLVLIGALVSRVSTPTSSPPLSHAQIVTEHRKAASEDAASIAALAEITKVAKKINAAEYLIHNTAISGDGRTAFLKVDQDVWDTIGHQDQTMMEQIFIGALDKAYRARHHAKPDLLAVRVRNLAGEQIASY